MGETNNKPSRRLSKLFDKLVGPYFYRGFALAYNVMTIACGAWLFALGVHLYVSAGTERLTLENFLMVELEFDDLKGSWLIFLLLVFASVVVSSFGWFGFLAAFNRNKLMLITYELALSLGFMIHLLGALYHAIRTGNLCAVNFCLLVLSALNLRSVYCLIVGIFSFHRDQIRNSITSEF